MFPSLEPHKAIFGLLCPVSGVPVQGGYDKLVLIQWMASLMVRMPEVRGCEKRGRKQIFLGLEGRKD